AFELGLSLQVANLDRDPGIFNIDLLAGHVHWHHLHGPVALGLQRLGLLVGLRQGNASACLLVGGGLLALGLLDRAVGSPVCFYLELDTLLLDLGLPGDDGLVALALGG